MNKTTICLLMSFATLAASALQTLDATTTIMDLKLNKTEIYRFENGLVLLVRQDRSSPVVSVQAWVATGSIHEGRWLGSGISHFVEHMLFKGTQRRGVGEIAREVHELGGQINAYTSLDRTVYYIDLPKNGWRKALDILIDAIFYPTFPEEEFAKEQEVIRREFAMGKDDPEREATQLLLETAFSVHPYKYPIIGHLDLFNKLTREDLIAYHQGRYVPENVTFIVVGDVEPNQVQEELLKLTSAIPRQFLAEVPISNEPQQLAPRYSHKQYKTSLLHLRIGWHIPGIQHPDSVALDGLAVVLGQGLSSRLHRKVVEGKGLAYGISSFTFLPLERGIFAVAATADFEKKNLLTQEIEEAITELVQDGVKEEELEKAKKQILVSYLSSLETVSGQAHNIGNAWLLTRNPDFARSYVEKVHSLKAEDLLSVAKKYLIPERRTIVSLHSSPYRDELNKSVSLDTNPGEKEQRKFVSKVLDNGVRILVYPDGRTPLANLQLVWLSGQLFEKPQLSGIATLTSNTLLKGTTNRTAEQISQEIENIGGSIEIQTGQNTTILQLQLLAQDLPTAVALAEDVLLRPKFDPAELERQRQIQLAALKQDKEQPMSVCSNLLRNHLYGPQHPYSLHPLGEETTLLSLKPDHLHEYHKRTFLGGNLVIVLSGDVDSEKAIELLSSAFSKISSGKLGIPVVQIPPRQQKTVVSQALSRQQAVIQIGYPGLAIDNPLRPVAEVVVEALSDISSRLFDRIREKQGLAYFVGASQRIGPIPGHVVLYAGCAPDKVDYVIQELLSEADEIARNGLTEEEIRRAKTKLLGELTIQYQSHAVLARSAALRELFGLGANSVFKIKEEIESVTSEQVRKLCSQIFNQHPVVAVVTPSVNLDTQTR